MMATLSLTVTYQPVEDGWVQARIAELPAVITSAPTQPQAAEQIIDALREYLLALGPATTQMSTESSTGRLTLTIEAA